MNEVVSYISMDVDWNNAQDILSPFPQHPAKTGYGNVLSAVPICFPFKDFG